MKGFELLGGRRGLLKAVLLGALLFVVLSATSAQSLSPLDFGNPSPRPEGYMPPGAYLRVEGHSSMVTGIVTTGYGIRSDGQRIRISHTMNWTGDRGTIQFQDWDPFNGQGGWLIQLSSNAFGYPKRGQIFAMYIITTGERITQLSADYIAASMLVFPGRIVSPDEGKGYETAYTLPSNVTADGKYWFTVPPNALMKIKSIVAAVETGWYGGDRVLQLSVYSADGKYRWSGPFSPPFNVGVLKTIMAHNGYPAAIDAAFDSEGVVRSHLPEDLDVYSGSKIGVWLKGQMPTDRLISLQVNVEEWLVSQ